jgi:hypothetical protein
MTRGMFAEQDSSIVTQTRAYLRSVGGHIQHAIKGLTIDAATAQFIQHNKKIWARGSEDGRVSEVLVDRFGIPQTVIAQSYTANVLAAKNNSRITTFSARRTSNRRLRKVYESFNAESHVTPVLTRSQKQRARSITREVYPQIHSKKDLLNLIMLGIRIGIDIYESYLTRFSEVTVDLQDARLYRLIEEAARRLLFWIDYFASHQVVAVINSHDNYLEFNSVNKVAYRSAVPVYLPNMRGIWKAERPFSVYEYFLIYRKLFTKMAQQDQAAALALAQNQIEKRLRGDVGVDMPYSTKSAFQRSGNGKRVLRRSDNIKVLICTHCFYDNPYAYGPILFEDFYEWLIYLGRISTVTEYDWYLKMHPDPRPGTEDAIRKILAHFPRITMIPHETSHHQLAAEGINFVLTVYGSVGHEYPLLGIPVINAGYNPHVAYNFTWTPATVAEYEQWLMDLGSLRKPIDLKEVYEFYFMHYYCTTRDDFFFKSFRRFLDSVDPELQNGSVAYTFFLNELTEGRHAEIVKNVAAYIDSGSTFPFKYDSEPDYSGLKS